MVICLKRGADCLHTVQLMPLPLQNPIISSHLNPDWFTLFVPAYPTSTQPCIPPRSLNRVPASAGVRAEMSPLPGGR